MPPLSLYVHLPWCVRKCPYCDFNSHRAPAALPEDAYTAALLRDFEWQMTASAGRPIETVFIGGGTPSLFSAHAVQRLLDGLRERTAFAADAEITLEANPGASDAARFEGYRQAGVNRLSIGVQSFRDDRLRALGRIHGRAEAVAAVRAAHDAGFTNVNIDLMYALPNDDDAGALEDLELALALEPAHLSWYQLTLEPGTQFHHRPPAGLPDDDVTIEIEARGRALLGQAGFQRYEVSAYAQPGRRCRHNENYWRFGDYIGIGAGAHGKLTHAGSAAIERRSAARNPLTYLEQAGTARAISVEVIESPSALAVEFLMNALRLRDGFTFDAFERTTGRPVEAFSPAFDAAHANGWLQRLGNHIAATDEGYRRLNAVLEPFVEI